MTLPDLVLVHGGAHAGDCWDLVLGELADRAPELRVLAVDLPGRGSKLGGRTAVTVADCVDSVVADIENAEFGDVVIVGHSMAGLTVPGVVAKLGTSRVCEMILVAAFVPPQGATVIDALRGPLVPLARLGVSVGRSFPMPTAAARFAFWNGMTREQRKFAVARLCQESVHLIVEPADRRDMPAAVPRTWILTLRDRALSVRQQYDCVRALGGVDTMFCFDAGHDVMFSDPERLAAILIERCRLYGG